LNVQKYSKISVAPRMPPILTKPPLVKVSKVTVG
jgi:hypothetical protein